MSSLQQLLHQELGQHGSKLAAHFQVDELAPGTALIHEGAHGAGDLCLVVAGQIEVRAEQPDGGFSVVKRVGSGHLLGLLGLVDGLPRSATCRAASVATVARMSETSFRQLYGARDEAGLAFVDWVARQLVADIRRLDGVLRDAARSKLDADGGESPS